MSDMLQSVAVAAAVVAALGYLVRRAWRDHVRARAARRRNGVVCGPDCGCE